MAFPGERSGLVHRKQKPGICGSRNRSIKSSPQINCYLPHMPTLDQENRDWTKGNCFYVTLEFMKDSEELRAIGSIPKDSCISLVHGLLSASEKCIKHAWIEIDNNVCDHSNNQAIRASVEDYYRDNDAVPCRRFSREETDALLGYLQDQEGSLTVGYWGNLSDEDAELILYCAFMESIKHEAALDKKYEDCLRNYACSGLQQKILAVFDLETIEKVGVAISEARADIVHFKGARKWIDKMPTVILCQLTQYLELTVIGYLLERLGVDRELIGTYQMLQAETFWTGI